jgi:sugar phosphate isomerase/epimerase
MIAISTSWRASKAKSGKELLNELMEVGAEALELEYRVSEEIFAELKLLLKKEQIPVLSVHNVFPATKIEAPFALSSPEAEERELAVKLARQTIQIASDLEAKAVILHLDSVPMDSRHEEIFRLYDEEKYATAEWDALIDKQMKERASKAAKSLDSALFSLDELNKSAERYDVWLGIENRYFYHEIPNLQEMDLIFDKFSGSQVRYWHDAGHAQVEQNFGWQDHKEMLERFSHLMVGCHLHDVEGHSDHKAPGTGEVDFNLLKDYVRSETLKVVEVFPEVEKEVLRDSLGYVARLFR